MHFQSKPQKNPILRAPSRVYNPTKIAQPSLFRRTQKLQNNLMIKPSSGNEKQKDYKFETQQEIETEQQCRKMGKTQIGSQKRNNSFSSIADLDDKIVEGKWAKWDKKGKESIKMKENRQSHEQEHGRFKEKKTKLGFYCCDSLAVRPSNNFNYAPKEQKVIVKQFSIQQLKGLSSGQDDQKPINRFQNLIERAHWSQPNEQFNKIEVQPMKNSRQDTQNKQQIERVNTAQYHSLRPSGYKHRKIFEQKYKIEKKLAELNQNLPNALIPSNPENRKVREQMQDEFHIIIETDQITSCCF